MSKPITTDDLRDFLALVEKNKEQYDDFNVIMVQTVLGALLSFIEGKGRIDAQDIPTATESL